MSAILKQIINSRESSTMPDTPPEPVTSSQQSVVQPSSVSPTSHVVGGSVLPAITTPPHSKSAAAMNGLHSPLPALNGSRGGRTPSPNSGHNVNSSQQLPPACGARQLSKLKRFLTTLQQFGSDISPEIGERVRTLVLGLVNSHLSIEEFHAKLQEATNFPLRPFVIPFLKANLPLLQRELLHCARLAKQTPQQYLAHNEHILFDPAHGMQDGGPAEVLHGELNENGKRRASSPGVDRIKDDSHDVHPPKRHQPHPISPGGGNNNRVSPNGPVFAHNNNFGPIRLEDISMGREMRERERAERESRERIERERFERERERHYSNSSFGSYHRDSMPFDHLDRQEDDWKHIENMLHCIVSMVDKTKRALSTLQERSQRDREELALWMRRHSDSDHDIKKRDNNSYNRSADERIGEVKRRAEDAVNEVKRQAVIELQKAVAAAEQKANELVAAEKVKMERAMSDVKKKAREEVLTVVNRQEESQESCWNCGRKANETCSGCNIARYCGSFCQHKDWEGHHRVCGQHGSGAKDGGPKSGPPECTTTTRPVPTPPATSPANSSSSTASVKGSRSNSPEEQTEKAAVTPTESR